MINRAKKAFSFVEILVASVALVVLLVPILVVMSSTLRTTAVSRENFRVHQYTLEILEQVRALPAAIDFRAIQERPTPNIPAPERPMYLCMDQGANFPLEGSLFFSGQEFERSALLDPPLDTKNWTITGNNLCLPTIGDPTLPEKTRLFLTPLGKDTASRFVQIFIPLHSTNPPVAESNLIKARARMKYLSIRSNKVDTVPLEYVLPCFIGNPKRWGAN